MSVSKQLVLSKPQLFGSSAVLGDNKVFLWFWPRKKGMSSHLLSPVQEQQLAGGAKDLLECAPLPVVSSAIESSHPVSEAKGPRSELEDAACVLQSMLCKKASFTIAQAAASRGVSSKTLTKRLSAVSEATVQMQSSIVSSLLKYLSQMTSYTIKPIAYIERQAYDSTPAKLRVPQSGGQEEQRIKLCMVENEIAFLVQRLDVEIPCAKDYLLLKVPLSAAARVAERGTAENTLSVISSALSRPSGVHEAVPVWRIAETDEEGSNSRAERLLTSGSAKQWEGATLHCFCSAHKVHCSAQRLWSLIPHIVTGCIHTLKSCDDISTIKAIKHLMKQEIRRRLRVFVGGARTQEADAYRRACMQLFLPQPSKAKSHVMGGDLRSSQWGLERTQGSHPLLQWVLLRPRGHGQQASPIAPACVVEAEGELFQSR